VRGRLASLAVRVSMAAILAAVALSTAAAARTVVTPRTVVTVPIHNGVTSVNLTVPHMTGLRPPAILLSTRPADLRCTVVSYRYHAADKVGTFGMRIRCRKVGRAAQARLVFRQPYVRVFNLRNGTGTVKIQLDKFPGSARPLAELTTRPRTTNCVATPAGSHVGKHLFTASAHVTCRGLPRNAKGVLAFGGLLAPSPTAALRAADRRSAGPSGRVRPDIICGLVTCPSSQKPCSSPITLTLAGKSVVSRITCYGTGIGIKPWYSAFFGFDGTAPISCPSGWQAKGTILAAYNTGSIYVEPTDSWAWSKAVGFVTNWQWFESITAMWSWYCFQFS
jgi:hypothetical protein